MGVAGHVTRTIWAKLRSPIPSEIWLIGPVVSEEKIFEECG